MRPRTANRFRASGAHSFGHAGGEGGDPLDTVIRSRETFWPTVNNAAEQRNIDTSQLIDALRRRLRPGMPVRLRDIHGAADALVDSGLAIPRVQREPTESELAAAMTARHAAARRARGGAVGYGT